MNANDPENTWKNLLAQSAPTFSSDPTPPYGFVTSTLAAMRVENRQQREFERIGIRAIWAALAALSITAAVTLTISLRTENSDFDPGVRSLVQVDNLPYS